MPSICIQIYVLGLLVLMGSRAEEVSVEGSISINSTSNPTDTPSTASLSPSTASLSPSTASLSPSTASLSPSTASLSPSTASLTPSTASLTPSTASLTPSTANLSPSTANQTAQTTSSGLTALSQSQGRETTETTTSLPVSATRGSDIAGYVILFLILLAVVCLVVILYILRKKSRRYSFDLQYPGYDHDTPLTCMEQPGTFEPNNDQAIWESEREGGDEDPHAMSPVANGSAMGAGETGSTGDNGEKQAHGESDGDSFNNFCASDVTPPIKRVGFSLDLDLSDKVLLGSGPDLFDP
uniref:cell wall integrity and stress response component 1 isoform X2 n=1 Tax=Oncorhynchus gorbuscha TaxID=8017 RepID=UPI001EAF383D|nr:cell wall integrity and stress response component 1 isoform X2 [Oncorhynchus gorbuscha]